MSTPKTARKKKDKARASSPGRCAIYEEIDSLADCMNLPEANRLPTLIAATQAILNQMAYYMINSDGALLETQERWHDKYTDRLYEAAGQARTEAVAQRAAAPIPSGSIAGNDRVPPAAIPVRRAPGDIPASLRRILNGSHESLRDDENDPD